MRIYSDSPAGHLSTLPGTDNATGEIALVEAETAKPLTAFTERTSLALALIVLVSIPLFFLCMGSWGFFDPDEGRYAEIPREMLERHDFVTPTLNYLKYFEKPPMLYWLVAGSFKVFGLNEWAGRLVPALAALAGLVIAYFLGRRMFGRRAGLISAVVLATSVFWTVMARSLIIDMLLSVAMFLASACWWMAHTETSSVTETSPRRRWYMMGFWAALAIAVLSKGPVAIILVGATIFCYMLICRDWRTLAKMEWLPGILVLLLIAAPWYIVVGQRNPEFNRFFWYDQNIARFLGTREQQEHVQSATWFIQFLPALLFPWSAFMPGALFLAKDKIWPARTLRQRAAIYLVCNAAVVILFFSASSGKLLPYVLPAFPPLALLVAAYFNWLIEHPSEAWGRPLKSGIILLGLTLTVVLVASLLVLPKFLRHAEQVSAVCAYALGFAVAIWLLALLIVARCRNLPALTAVVAGGFVLLFTMALPLIIAIIPNHQCKGLITYIRPGLERGGTFMSRDYMQSVNFYSRKRVAVNGLLGELKFGSEQISAAEKADWLPRGKQRLKAGMDGSTPFYYMVKDHKLAQALVRELGPRAVEITWNKRRSIIGNRAAAALTPPRKNDQVFQ